MNLKPESCIKSSTTTSIPKRSVVEGSPNAQIRQREAGTAMSAALSIDDRIARWRKDLDVWVVPVGDALGPVGATLPGKPVRFRARACNCREIDMLSARVDFGWWNPAMAVARTLATPARSAFVDLTTGAAKAAHCRVPWVPSFENGGRDVR